VGHEAAAERTLQSGTSVTSSEQLFTNSCGFLRISFAEAMYSAADPSPTPGDKAGVVVSGVVLAEYLLVKTLVSD
jgi:hypothetical protein